MAEFLSEYALALLMVVTLLAGFTGVGSTLLLKKQVYDAARQSSLI